MEDMAEYRQRKETDNENIEKAKRLLLKVVEKNPEIEPALWSSACFSAIAEAFIDNDLTYKHFKTEMENAIKHYKSWWN